MQLHYGGWRGAKRKRIRVDVLWNLICERVLIVVARISLLVMLFGAVFDSISEMRIFHSAAIFLKCRPIYTVCIVYI